MTFAAEHTLDAAGIGRFYDTMGDYFATVFGGQNIHFGYWDGPGDRSTPQEAQKRLTALALEELRPALGGGDWLLDVGCGTGGPGILATETLGCSTTGITVSRAQVAEAHRRAGPGSRFRPQLADAMDLPFPDASFDAAWALESVFHMEDQRRVFSETARVLRPGGALVIADIVRTGPMDPATAELTAATLWSPPLVHVDDYRSSLEASGFVVHEVRDISRNCARTVDLIHRVHLAKANELREIYGDLMVEQLLRDFPTVVEAFATGGAGYILVTAAREG